MLPEGGDVRDVQGQSTCREATICSSVQQVVPGCGCPSRCTQTARGQKRLCQTASHRFYFYFFCRAFRTNVPNEIWAEVIPILAPVRAPSQAHTVKSPHWHCYSGHGSTEKDAGCAHAWLSLGPNLLSILQGSNHNNGRLAKSKEVGGLFIWLNKPSLNAQITTTGSSLLQRLSAGVDVSSDTKSDVTYDGMFITFKGGKSIQILYFNKSVDSRIKNTVQK